MTYRDNPEIAKKYYSRKWKKLRHYKLIQNPLCERCLQKGFYNAAKIVHHKEYITETNYLDDNVFFNIDNLEALCQDCHNKEHFEDKKEYTFDINGDVIKVNA